MTPLQKLRYAVLLKAASWGELALPDVVSSDNVDALWDELVASDGHWDARNEVRCAGEDTGFPVPWAGQVSRNYESKGVAAQMPDGSWVGWTFWYGGGKHGRPEEIEWMEDAYDLDCVEQEVMVIQRTFTKKVESE